MVPELVEVSGKGSPTVHWQDSFDAVLEDVFRVQGEIATRVAAALKVTLGAKEQRRLAMSLYFQYVSKDNLRGLDQCSQGLAIDGGNVDLLLDAASSEIGLGLWDEGHVHLEHARSLDPRSVRTAIRLGSTLLRIPCYLSPGWLAIDPNFAPLKGHPRFEKLPRAKD